MSLAYSIALITFIGGVLSADDCPPLNGVVRECKYWGDCRGDTLTLLKKPFKSKAEKEQVRAIRCGSLNNYRVCCPMECYTWDGRLGECRLYTKTLFSNYTSRQLKYSKCGAKYACFSDLPVRKTGDTENDRSATIPDPSLGVCGIDPVAKDKIIATNCPPLNGVLRECKYWGDCRGDTLTLLKKPIKSKAEKEQVQAMRCGAPENSTVCCPMECYTWDGRLGECRLYTKTLFINYTARQLKYSKCAAKSVCYSDLPILQTGNTENDISTFIPDPSLGGCGIEHVAQDKIIGGNKTTIEEFPWLAVLKFPGDNKNCSGTLISGKYVLTAGHCVHELLPPTPYAVVLGEYDKATTRDCDAYNNCHESTISVPIEEIKIHPGFNPTNPLKRDDIAMIRLKYLVKYSDYIQPICLPSNDITSRPPPNLKLEAAGWGVYNVSIGITSDVKLKVKLPFVDYQPCAQKVGHLWSKQMCAGGEQGKDTCEGDSGGPLMYENGGTFELLGITSYGLDRCGNHTPAVYTKVYSYIQWIHSVIRP